MVFWAARSCAACGRFAGRSPRVLCIPQVPIYFAMGGTVSFDVEHEGKVQRVTLRGGSSYEAIKRAAAETLGLTCGPADYVFVDDKGARVSGLTDAPPPLLRIRLNLGKMKKTTEQI